MPKTILLLDDSRTVREVLKVYLMGHDFTFLEAEDGEQALEILRAGQVDLVLADIKPPEARRALVLADRARERLAGRAARPRGAHHRRQGRRREAEEQGRLADALLFKPLKREQLIQVVTELLAERSP